MCKLARSCYSLYKFMKRILFLLVFGVCSHLFSATSISIVIIGGGPAGLATAIEAKSQGAHVTVVEKRAAYSREQGLILQDSSIGFLNKWNVSPKFMRVFDFGNGEKIGVAQLKLLEEALLERAKSMGITLLHAEFLHLNEGTVEILADNQTLALPYDLLVAADGVHSRVREELGIEAMSLGKAKGAAIAFRTNQIGDLEINDAIVSGAYFARKISTSSFCLFFIQSFPDVLDPISRKDLELAARDCGWHEEADSIAEGKGVFFEDIPVFLQQAKDFSSPKLNAVIIGDAAACASFYQGMGANTALKTAVLAGELIQKLQARDADAYETFNQKMKETTDELIDDSRFLFFLE